MNVLSLFDGKSSGYTAMELAGLPITNYYSSEVDKYAVQVSNAIHPNQTRLGDVTKWREWDIEWDSIDLILAGSPCQGFSFAGKQLAFDDPRSALFFTFVDILNHVKSLNPDVKFMLENVKMKKEYLDVISEHVGVQPVFINSSLVSAQNRQRYYWANGGEIAQPDDRGVILADIIESGVADRDKSWCVDANYSKGGNLKSYFLKNRRQLIFGENKPGTLTTVHRDNIIAFTDNYVQCDVSGKGYKSQDQRVYYLHGKIGALAAHRTDSKTNTLFEITNENIKYRKLTPRECFRLQTVPEHYIDKILSCGVSNTQLYKIAGNGWTDEVIAHNLCCIFNKEK